MNFVTKQLLVASLALVVISPAIANDGVTKGSKSYQSRPAANAEQPTAKAPQAQSAEDVAAVAPAAGDQMDTGKPADQGKTFREDMGLPRKN